MSTLYPFTTHDDNRAELLYGPYFCDNSILRHLDESKAQRRMRMAQKAKAKARRASRSSRRRNGGR